VTTLLVAADCSENWVTSNVVISTGSGNTNVSRWLVKFKLQEVSSVETLSDRKGLAGRAGLTKARPFPFSSFIGAGDVIVVRYVSTEFFARVVIRLILFKSVVVSWTERMVLKLKVEKLLYPERA